MAQQDATKNETKQKTTSTSKLKRTFSRIEEMEQKFQSLKQSLADKIKVELENKNNTPNDTKQDENPISITRTEEQCEEFFDDEKTLKIKLKKLATLIKKSKHFVGFTGAGISTAAGIADFRSGINTTLDTGTGQWAKQTAIRQGKSKQIKKAKKKSKGVFKTIPTASHMALVALMSQQPKYLKYLVSQNTDGLHRRSGIPPSQMSELHGNSALEICMRCKKEYLRDYRCRNSLMKQACHDHKTGRYCVVPNCKGRLQDTIINFNENLLETVLDLAEEHHEEADLCLVLGSSLTVTPAKTYPENVGLKWNLEVAKYPNKEPKHNLCIVNLQKTDCDDLCSLRIFAKIDDVMIGLMKELEMDIPIFKLNRYVKIKLEDEQQKKLIICGVDSDGIDASIFTAVKLFYNGEKIKNKKTFISSKEKRFVADEYLFNIPNVLEINNINNEEIKENFMDNKKGLVLELVFYGNYNEPNLFISLNEYMNDLCDGYIVLKMEMDILKNSWNVGNRMTQVNDINVMKLWSVYQKKVEEEKKQNEMEKDNDNDKETDGNNENDYAKKYFMYDD
eukprot:164570_1